MPCRAIVRGVHRLGSLLLLLPLEVEASRAVGSWGEEVSE